MASEYNLLAQPQAGQGQADGQTCRQADGQTGSQGQSASARAGRAKGGKGRGCPKSCDGQEAIVVPFDVPVQARLEPFEQSAGSVARVSMRHGTMADSSARHESGWTRRPAQALSGPETVEICSTATQGMDRHKVDGFRAWPCEPLSGTVIFMHLLSYLHTAQHTVPIE
ncbi:hypothetical protein J1614_005653 [Plenodomus biglobosus]|nr:hypothetical protein J1614_005653 [Plenodomus biglobosus]